MIPKRFRSDKNAQRREKDHIPIEIQELVVIQDILAFIYDQYISPCLLRNDTKGLTNYIEKNEFHSSGNGLYKKEVSIG